MSNAIAKKNDASIMASYTREQIDLIKDTVAKGTTDNELKLFLYQAQRSGLDPLAKQIHAIKRWNSKTRREEMAIQTAIDGFRLIADRTGKYAGNEDAVHEYDEDDGKLKASTVKVFKMVQNQLCPFSATARMDEYKPKAGQDFMWVKMPHVMLDKCAEALALRKAFPAELSGIYTNDEMAQADNSTAPEIVKMGNQNPAKVTSFPGAETEGEQASRLAANDSSSDPLPREKPESVMFEGRVYKTAGISESFAAIAIYKKKHEKNDHQLRLYLNGLGLRAVSDLTEAEAQAFLESVKPKKKAAPKKKAEAEPKTGPEPEAKGDQARLRAAFYAKVRDAGLQDYLDKIKKLCKMMYRLESFSTVSVDKLELINTYIDRYIHTEEGINALKITLDSLKEPNNE